MGLDVIRERCAGIDVHKRQITVCVQVPQQQVIREFPNRHGVPADDGGLAAGTAHR
jgi:hypothetical protein